MFVRHHQLPGARLFDALRAKDILVRRWDHATDIGIGCAVSVGTMAQAEQLLHAVREIVSLRRMYRKRVFLTAAKYDRPDAVSRAKRTQHCEIPRDKIRAMFVESNDGAGG